MSEHIYSATMDNGGSIKVYIWGLLITASNQVLGYSPMWTREGACNFFLNDQNNSDLDELGFNLTHIEGEPIATFKLNEGDNQVKVKVELEVDINLLNQYLGKSKGVSIEKSLGEFLCGQMEERDEYGNYEQESTGVAYISLIE